MNIQTLLMGIHKRSVLLGDVPSSGGLLPCPEWALHPEALDGLCTTFESSTALLSLSLQGGNTGLHHAV